LMAEIVTSSGSDLSVALMRTGVECTVKLMANVRVTALGSSTAGKLSSTMYGCVDGASVGSGVGWAVGGAVSVVEVAVAVEDVTVRVGGGG
jgi:hypothetical protein